MKANWKTFLKKKGVRLGALILVIVLIAAAAAAGLRGRAGLFTDLEGMLRAPLQEAAATTAGWLESLYGNIYRYDRLQAECEELRNQLAAAQAEAREGHEAVEENKRLRELLSFRQRHSDFELEPARVISYSASNWSSIVTISKGEDAEIAVGDSVMTESGSLVGQVIEVGSNWSAVRTVIDVDVSIGGFVSNSGAAAMVLGDYTLMQDGCVKLGYLTEDVSIFSGDTVMTSGKGGAFPAGLVIGMIREVRTEAGGQEVYGVIRPACDLRALAQVFVIKDFQVVE